MAASLCAKRKGGGQRAEVQQQQEMNKGNETHLQVPHLEKPEYFTGDC